MPRALKIEMPFISADKTEVKSDAKVETKTEADEPVKPVAAKPEPAKPEQRAIRAVHGPMVDLLTGTTYTPIPTVHYGKPNGWVQSQLDAGKLEWL